jgi:AAA domain
MPLPISTKPLTLMPKPIPPTAKPPAPVARAAKSFVVEPWDDGGGEKIILYGKSGIGKTTLATMAPNPIFIGVDDGARKIKNPKTGAPVNAVKGVQSFVDIRDAVHNVVFPAGSSLVIDTITAVQKLAEQYTFDNVKVGNKSPTSLEEYGYGKGYRYLCETMRLLLTDLGHLVRKGVNVILLAQDSDHRVSTKEGADYLEAGPELDWHGSPNVLAEYLQWADHILRIAYPPPNVMKSDVRATKGKATGSHEQQILMTGDIHFLAKNRLMPPGRVPPVVSFAEPADDSLWKFVFEGATV